MDDETELNATSPQALRRRPTLVATGEGAHPMERNLPSVQIGRTIVAKVGNGLLRG